jgi:hypothetical protein
MKKIALVIVGFCFIGNAAISESKVDHPNDEDVYIKNIDIKLQKLDSITKDPSHPNRHATIQQLWSIEKEIKSQL